MRNLKIIITIAIASLILVLAVKFIGITDEFLKGCIYGFFGCAFGILMPELFKKE